MVSAYVTTDILTLVEIRIVGIFIHCFFAHVDSWAHHNASSTRLICVVQCVRIRHILSVDSSAFDHGQLLRIQKVIGIRGESTRDSVFLALLIVVTSHHQVREFLLSLSELFVILFLV